MLDVTELEICQKQSTLKCIESFIILFIMKALDMKRGSGKPVAVVIPSKQTGPEESNPE